MREREIESTRVSRGSDREVSWRFEFTITVADIIATK
jgi:hypothetical protein